MTRPKAAAKGAEERREEIQRLKNKGQSSFVFAINDTPARQTVERGGFLPPSNTRVCPGAPHVGVGTPVCAADGRRFSWLKVNSILYHLSPYSRGSITQAAVHVHFSSDYHDRYLAITADRRGNGDKGKDQD